MPTERKTTNRMTSRDQQAAERRQQILDIAKRLFAEKGYHATSMRELNKEIGMAEALTYHYFPGGKLEILKSVLQTAQEDRISKFVEFFDELFQGGAELEDVLLPLIEGITQRFKEDQPYFQILIRERNLLDQEQQEALNGLTKQPFEALADYLSKLAAKGDVRSMNFEMASSQFLSHIVVRVVRESWNGGELRPEEMQQIADFYIQLWSK
ncbi:MAG: TetR/AcrR family transcriptional regulator [Paenibacillus sp.]|uniref:TetR/AcrR family transcriptional regulator n=1 Tax=Paenibacillus sp. TaxID=58172 RepID=UPI0029082C93|nr:TetR/AcrR family transcriptional regulator [Paenibacillus sp.]MDU4694728.1 TetR/AcrR family transcriptional regulator [Paenibacillus sp.]